MREDTTSVSPLGHHGESFVYTRVCVNIPHTDPLGQFVLGTTPAPRARMRARMATIAAATQDKGGLEPLLGRASQMGTRVDGVEGVPGGGAPTPPTLAFQPEEARWDAKPWEPLVVREARNRRVMGIKGPRIITPIST